MSHRRLIVLKFGGSVLTSPDSLRSAVHEIYRWRRDDWRVVAVVSALEGETDALIAETNRLSPDAGPAARAAMVCLGEFKSAALLGLQLERAGIPARVLSPAGVDLVAAGSPVDSDPVSVNAAHFERALDEDGVVVFPGFVAVDDRGRPVLLGRGGSDLSAVFLAQKLGAARCRLVKDVDALYTSDPAKFDPAKHAQPPARYSTATWDTAFATDGSIIQQKALRFARSHGYAFELGRLNATNPTTIGASHTSTTPASEIRPARRFRVALLGLGVVGGGVLDLLSDKNLGFDVVGASVRSTSRDARVPLHADPVALASSGADIVVEAMGGVEPARRAIEGALNAGSHVVTANKAVIAAHGQALRRLAQDRGRLLLCGASVGGVAPVLETIAANRERRLVALRGVLNGTTNFILNLVASGQPFDAALLEAQKRGFAEADPSRDLDGRDAGDKLVVSAHAAGHTSLRAEEISRDALSAASIERTRQTLQPGARLRHVASWSHRDGAVRAGVRIEAIAPGDPLFTLDGPENLAQLHWSDGSTTIVRGRGAGRWPTAEAVIGDLQQIAREVSR